MALSINQRLIPATNAQLADIEALLRDCGLPYQDCAEHLSNFVTIVESNRLCATGGLEVLGSLAMLRSVAVSAGERGKGLGQLVTAHLLEQAKLSGIVDVYLLTESADEYFKGLGFRAVDREQLPDQIQATAQFSALCPASASAMRLVL